MTVIPTGAVGPAGKRDIGAQAARGDLLAFLDDDAYPSKHWLADAVREFSDERIAGVGGPAVTPPEDTVRQKASGRIFSSPLVSGAYVYRYLPRKRRFVDDLPSCNLFIRSDVFRQAGGFNTRYWPGEDTILCRAVTTQLGRKLLYTPECLVCHHRRPVFIPHLRQIASYALHRGYFARKYPETSRRFAYFLPSVFVFLLGAGFILSAALPVVRPVYLGALSVYAGLTLICSLSKTLGLIPLVFSGIIISHITYGIFFLKGLFARSLREETVE